MSRPFILLGDKTNHGGVVITASETSDCNGKGIARVGDKVKCPKNGHGNVTTIVTGDPTAIIDGRAAARHGDQTSCGATLIASQSLTTD
ncbi:PAAR domain-containing protein [Quatrionicoccus australiensis]|uniref:PAAR domain-containing protein n=1 Tax=Quatrionicoccus australiensis TaxID=138118 RepID=UPI001CFB30CD|nr:PAAR domain-containing protein [Quatrionicoccus australiensis]MCB4359517.1 PAAR domain-containing protein [Quatrionicoccus australiensis]